MKHSIHNPRLKTLARLAEDRLLEYHPGIADNEFLVTSYSDADHSYLVVLDKQREEIECRRCRAAARGEACTHVALIVSTQCIPVWMSWRNEDVAERNKLRLEIQTGRLSPSQRRRVNRYMKQVEAKYGCLVTA